VVAFFFFLFLQFFLFRCGMLRFFNARKVPSINVKVSLIIFLHFQSCFDSIMEKFHHEQIPGVGFSSVICFFFGGTTILSWIKTSVVFCKNIFN